MPKIAYNRPKSPKIAKKFAKNRLKLLKITQKIVFSKKKLYFLLYFQSNQWEMTIQSGCTQSTQYTQQETACLIANNEEYFSQFNIKTYALETKQKKQFSSYSKDEQNLKVSVQKKPCDNLNNAKCVQIDGRKHIKDLVDESYHSD